MREYSLSPAPALCVESLRYSHPKGGGNIPAFRDLHFRLERGEALALAGVNGSGKSTLLCLLAGLYPCGSGRLEVFGVDLARAPETERRNAIARTALLMQDPDMQILGATVEEDIVLGAAGKARERDHALLLARRFGLESQLDSPPHTLSYGQRRKLCLAVALLRRPSLLLLDEPFSGLDYPAVKELRGILQEFKAEGISLVVSTHDLEPVLSFTDKMLFLSQDGTPLFGPPEEVLDHAAGLGIRPPLLRDFF